MSLTNKQFNAVFPRASSGYLSFLNACLLDHGISRDLNEISMFLAQISHESRGLTALTENLDYSVFGLMRTFPTRPSVWRFGRINSRPANQEAIANTVYANRLGNRSAASGDGWLYRGRGCIQITGRANYQAFGRLIGVDLERQPERALEPGVMFKLAGAYWRSRACAAPARRGDVRVVTQIINGGRNGLSERQAEFDRIKKLLVS